MIDTVGGSNAGGDESMVKPRPAKLADVPSTLELLTNATFRSNFDSSVSHAWPSTGGAVHHGHMS